MLLREYWHAISHFFALIPDSSIKQIYVLGHAWSFKSFTISGVYCIHMQTQSMYTCTTTSQDTLNPVTDWSVVI